MAGKNKKKIEFKIRLLPVMVFSALILLLLRVHSYSVPVSGWPNLPLNNDAVFTDVFSYIKSATIFGVSIWAALTLGYLLVTGQMKLKKSVFYIPMAVYVFGVLISYFLSDIKYIAWNGVMDRFEGTRTILCYIFMLFYTINVVDDLKDAMYVIYSTFVGVFLACVIGFSQLIGQDLLFVNPIKYMIAGDLKITPNFWPGQVYQTVYNMNYVGMYLALVVPILVYLIVKGVIDLKNKTEYELGMTKRKKGIIIALESALLLIILVNVWGAESSGSIIAVLSTFAALIFFVLDKRNYRILILVISIAGAVFAAIFYYNSHPDTRAVFDYFITGEDSLTVSVDGNEMIIHYDALTGDYSLTKGTGEAISVFSFEQGRFLPDDSDFKHSITMIPGEVEGKQYLVLECLNENMAFRFGEDGVFLLNDYGNEVKLDKIKSFGFENHLNVGSSRGYIWSRTLPLLKNSILFGTGADTFAFVFPQDDYAGKISAGCPISRINDKPHNMYLMILVCTGGISLLAFLWLMGLFFIKVMQKREEKSLLIAIGAGVLGFLVAGMFYDSNVSIAPMFYSMLGLGISLVSKS